MSYSSAARELRLCRREAQGIGAIDNIVVILFSGEIREVWSEEYTQGKGDKLACVVENARKVII